MGHYYRAVMSTFNPTLFPTLQRVYFVSELEASTAYFKRALGREDTEPDKVCRFIYLFRYLGTSNWATYLG